MKLMLVLCVAGLVCVAKPHMEHESFDQKHHKAGADHESMDHEAVLGSHKTAEEYGHLEPEEAKRRLRVLAAKMDADKDGAVDLRELTTWIHQSLMELDREEVRERFPGIDDNKDGFITWEEYIKDAFGDDDPEENQDFMDEDKKYFDSADRNVDGKLDVSEFEAFQKPENHPHMWDVMVKSTMEERDGNKDGQLDFKEFMSGVDESEDQDWFNEEKARFETEYDKNQNGVLDLDEVRKWISPDMSESAKDEATHLIKQTDKNADGKLSYEEILEQNDLWVGSEATKYGKKLHDPSEF